MPFFVDTNNLCPFNNCNKKKNIMPNKTLTNIKRKNYYDYSEVIRKKDKKANVKQAAYDFVIL